ncbi:response regulator transcription factor [Streptomyces sp. SAJ15]|uniref:response regulator transcription factor n=1 Tax=Streptomyces sp. SAJ15 TaxID=2011095 RepID=UPI0021B3D086|nr:response regulator transcription factor [Streptomyces sp. SAJ15]
MAGNVFYRAGLAHVLSAEAAFEIVAEWSTVSEARARLGRRRPDVVLVGVDTPTAAHIADLTHLRAAAPYACLVALLAQDDPQAVRRVLAAGARAAIPQCTTPEELGGTIRGVVRGRDRVVLSVSQRTLAGLRAPRPTVLTHRELEIVVLVARGLRNSQIADELVITEGTVKRHLSNVYAKLDAACRTEAVRKAMERGMVPPLPAAEPAAGYETGYGAVG